MNKIKLSIVALVVGIFTFSNLASAQYKANSVENIVKEIRQDFTRINNTKKWVSVKEYALPDDADGNIVGYISSNNNIEKVVVTQMASTGKKITEYYLKNAHLVFVYEKEYEYNRPYYWDKKMMQENGDTEYFDINKSKITETRFYFNDWEMIRKLKDNSTDFPDYILQDDSGRIFHELNEAISQIP